MDKQSDQKLIQAKQHFTKALENAHKAILDVKKHCELEIKSAQAHSQESLKQKINELDQMARELKKTADESISQSLTQAKEKLVTASNDALRTIEKDVHKAQTDLSNLPPKAKEAFNQAIEALKKAAQDIKNLLTTVGSSK